MTRSPPSPIDRRIATLWDEGRNTYDIARLVGMTEHEVDRRLPWARRLVWRDTEATKS